MANADQIKFDYLSNGRHPKYYPGGVGTTVSEVSGSSIKSYPVNQPGNVGILYRTTFSNQTFTSVRVDQSTLFDSCIFEAETSITISGNETSVNFRNCAFANNVEFHLSPNIRVFFTANGYSFFTGPDSNQNMYFYSSETQSPPNIIFDTFFIVDTLTEVNLFFESSLPFNIDFQSLSFIKANKTESITYNIHMPLEMLNNPASKVNLPGINSKFVVYKT